MAYAKIEPTGCGEFHGNVKVRLAFYLEPGDARYDERHYLVPIIPPEGYQGKLTLMGMPTSQADYDAWLESLPKKWVLAPFHNHFIYCDPDITEQEIQDIASFHLPNFYRAWLEEKDKIKGGMRSGWAVETRVRPIRYEGLDKPEIFTLRRAQAQEKADLLKVSNLSVRSKDVGEIFPSTDIDIGVAATDRGANAGATLTYINEDNPANDTGAIDEVEIFAWTINDLADCEVATFTEGDTDVFSTRDTETIGAVTAGSKQTFSSLDMDVATGDYIGIYFSAGTIERDNTGYIGHWYAAGDNIPCTDVTFSSLAGRTISLYGTGETAAVPTIVTPPTISLTLTEYAPSIVIGTVVIPSTLNLIITAYASILKEVLTPSTASLTITAYSPVLKEIITPGTLSLTITSYAPSVVKGTVVTPSTLNLILTAYAPSITISNNITVTPSTASLTITAYSPILKEIVTPTTLSLILTKYAPILKEIVTPTTLSLILTKYAPILIEGTIITPGKLGLILTTYAPFLGVATVITPETLNLILTKYAPDIILKIYPSGALGYTIEVRDSSGNLLVVLENATGINLVEQLNRPPMLDFILPADDSKISHIDPDNEIWLRDYETGTLIRKFLLSRRSDTRG